MLQCSTFKTFNQWFCAHWVVNCRDHWPTILALTLMKYLGQNNFLVPFSHIPTYRHLAALDDILPYLRVGKGIDLSIDHHNIFLWESDKGN